MPIVKVPVEWPGILELSRHLIMPPLPPSSSCSTQLVRSVRLACRYHAHNIVWLLNAPEKIGDSILSALDCIHIPYIHAGPIEPHLHRISRHISRPELALFYQHARKQPHLTKLRDAACGPYRHYTHVLETLVL